jgi:hypothetical protein
VRGSAVDLGGAASSHRPGCGLAGQLG